MKRTALAVACLIFASVAVAAEEARTVTLSDRSVTDIYTAPFASTMIVLPRTSKVTAVDVGASESWAAAYTGDNVVRVKQQFGARVKGRPVDVDPPAYSNMNVQTNDGHTLSFRLVPSGGPDWKVFVEYAPSKEQIDERAAELAACKGVARESRARVEHLETSLKIANEKIAALVDPNAYAREIAADYRIGKAAKAPFRVTEVYRTPRRTYVKGAQGLRVLGDVHSTPLDDGVIQLDEPLDKFWVQVGSKKALIERSATEVAKNKE